MKMRYTLMFFLCILLLSQFQCVDPIDLVENVVTRITGVIQDENGQPLKEIPIQYVSLFQEDDIFPRYNYYNNTKTDEKGNFELFTPSAPCGFLNINGFLREQRTGRPSKTGISANLDYYGRLITITVIPEENLDINFGDNPIILPSPAFLTINTDSTNIFLHHVPEEESLQVCDPLLTTGSNIASGRPYRFGLNDSLYITQDFRNGGTVIRTFRLKDAETVIDL